MDFTSEIWAAPASYGLQPAANGLQPASNGLQPAAYGLQPAAEGLQPAAYALQPAAYALQPTAYALQPTADALQPAADALQPAADGLRCGASAATAADPHPLFRWEVSGYLAHNSQQDRMDPGRHWFLERAAAGLDSGLFLRECPLALPNC